MQPKITLILLQVLNTDIVRKCVCEGGGATAAALAKHCSTTFPSGNIGIVRTSARGRLDTVQH